MLQTALFLCGGKYIICVLPLKFKKDIMFTAYEIYGINRKLLRRHPKADAAKKATGRLDAGKNYKGNCRFLLCIGRE